MHLGALGGRPPVSKCKGCVVISDFSCSWLLGVSVIWHVGPPTPPLFGPEDTTLRLPQLPSSQYHEQTGIVSHCHWVSVPLGGHSSTADFINV